MSEYDSIRPFLDHEVPSVIQRLVTSPELAIAASELAMPKLLANNIAGQTLTRLLLLYKTRGLKTIRDCQKLVTHYFDQVVARSIDNLSVSGLEHLDPNKPYLFISNHRDILMDSSLINYLIQQAGHDTCRMAVGDNLLSNSLAADLMRLNKSFIVERDVDGMRAYYRALTKTSGYIRHSLDEGVSVWIAQREGRAKDGFDRTDPALLKMLLLAYRDEDAPLSALLTEVQIVPVSVSYEVDPCGIKKAEELVAIARNGVYEKSEHEDLQSMILGLMGYKGRVHLSFARPISGLEGLEEVEQLAERLDKDIVSNYRTFPTHRYAAKTLAGGQDDEATSTDKALLALKADLALCGTEEKANLLQQYANVWENRKALGID
ncbi:MAG: 1-acyl-sn-glycerol-3-phosphate acyltransferase [Pseudomonadales bacterium]